MFRAPVHGGVATRTHRGSLRYLAKSEQLRSNAGAIS